MFVVYWSVVAENGERTPSCQEFPSSDMTAALQFTNDLRNTENIKHVVMSAQMDDNVGKMGVSDPDADYSWKKTRSRSVAPLRK